VGTAGSVDSEGSVFCVLPQAQNSSASASNTEITAVIFFMVLFLLFLFICIHYMLFYGVVKRRERPGRENKKI
jgi:heme/copper-type cytochrome/quinol oxidase subunit 2